MIDVEENVKNNEDYWVYCDVPMGRLIKDMQIGDGHFNALFDTGSERSYISPDVPMDNCVTLDEPFSVKIGGKTRIVKKRCIMNGAINGLKFDFSAFPLDELGIIDGKKVDILIGATAMEEWDIIIDPKDRKMNLKGLKNREFLEL